MCAFWRVLLVVAIFVATSGLGVAAPLPGTSPSELDGDLADRMVAGIDRFLLGEIDASVARRPTHWQRDLSSAEKYNASVAPNRARLAKIIGAHDTRQRVTALDYISTTAEPALVGSSDRFEVFAVRWPAVRGVTGEGLLLLPKGRAVIADVVAIPDADQSPEQLAGLAEGLAPESQFARRLAESGCRVVVPMLIDRAETLSAIGPRKTNQPHREFLYRPAFEMGRHIVGYEVQKVLAAVDYFAHDNAPSGGASGRPIGVAGYGEGGLLALHGTALDPRIECGVGQRLLRLATRRLAGANLSQCVWVARSVRRRRAGQSRGPAGAGRRSLSRAGGRRTAEAARGPQQFGRAGPPGDAVAGRGKSRDRTSRHADGRPGGKPGHRTGR